jgi:hypothetical protein
MLLWPRCVDATAAVAVDKNAGLERFQEVVEYRGQPRDFGALHAEMDGDGAAPGFSGGWPRTHNQPATPASNSRRPVCSPGVTNQSRFSHQVSAGLRRERQFGLPA